MSFTTEYSETEIVPLSADLASVRTQFETTVHNPDHGDYQFGGTVTMLLERVVGSWHIVSGHTSTRKPRGGGS
jgi:hypothetical protein